MEFLLCELMQPLLTHLDTLDFGRLQRTSKALRDASCAHEERYLSCTRMVAVYRRAHEWNGRIQVSWSAGGSVEYFDLEPQTSARSILWQLWCLKQDRNDLRCSLFVDCVLMPGCFDGGIVPCYLFKTDSLVQSLVDVYGHNAYTIDSGWPVYIPCILHYYRRCHTCSFENRFRRADLQLPVQRALHAASLVVD